AMVGLACRQLEGTRAAAGKSPAPTAAKRIHLLMRDFLAAASVHVLPRERPRGHELPGTEGGPKRLALLRWLDLDLARAGDVLLEGFPDGLAGGLVDLLEREQGLLLAVLAEDHGRALDDEPGIHGFHRVLARRK